MDQQYNEAHGNIFVFNNFKDDLGLLLYSLQVLFVLFYSNSVFVLLTTFFCLIFCETEKVVCLLAKHFFLLGKNDPASLRRPLEKVLETSEVWTQMLGYTLVIQSIVKQSRKRDSVLFMLRWQPDMRLCCCKVFAMIFSGGRSDI